MTALLYPGSPMQAKPKAACGVFPGVPDTNQRSVSQIMGSPTQTKPKAAGNVFPGVPDTNQRSVCGGEKRRQASPLWRPAPSDATALPNAICPTSPRIYRTLIDGTPFFLCPLRPNRIRTTALRAAMHRPCLGDLPAISPFLVYLREPIPGLP